MRSMFKIRFALFFLMCLCNHGQAFGGEDRFISFYAGRACYDSLKDILSNREYADSYVTAVLIGKELKEYKHYFQLESEGQIVKHWGYQDHIEFNGLLVFRWLAFPWDRYLDTSFAVGEGLSYATDDPKLEIEKHDRTARLLNYLMFEIAADMPRQPRWTIFVRIHHRSGVFGLFDGISGGSNVVGAGLRYAF